MSNGGKGGGSSKSNSNSHSISISISSSSSGFGDYWDNNNNNNKGDTTTTTTTYHDNVALGLRLHQHQQNNQLYSLSPSPSPSPGGEGCTKAAFTANQRQELERQTVIYKYMMSSMPVPPELIVPLPKYPPSLQSSSSSSASNRKAAMEMGSGRSAEPWRCKRTDGKKWRCSRDVAPDQKYCERHSHKTRPSARSRKPVESPLLLSPAPTTTTTTTCTSSVLNSYQHHHPSSYDFTSSLRYPQWLMKNESVTPTAQILYPHQLEHFPHATSPSDAPQQQQRPFIDAWSLENATTNLNKYPDTSSSSSMDSILPLTLSMSAARHDDHCVRETESSSHQQPLNWMSSWANLPSGGPLAEALCLGISAPTDAWATHSDETPHGHGHGKGSHASGDTSCQGFHFQ